MSVRSWIGDLFSVKSFNDREGHVVPESGDYTAAQITFDGATSGIAATDVQSAIDALRQEFAEVTAAGLSGTYNALAIAGFDTASSVTITTVNAGSSTINGIVAPAVDVNGLVKIIKLSYGTFTTTIVHNSGSAAAADRIITTSGANITNQGPGNTDVYVMLTRANGSWFATPLGTRSIVFGTTSVPLSVTAPTTNQLLAHGGSNILGVAPGAVMPRMVASNSNATALTFSSNQRLIWIGSTTPSFTYSPGSDVDGATTTIFFPASLGLTTFTLSTDLDPTQTVAYAFDGGASAYMLICTYYSTGPCIVSSMRKVTDL